MWEFLKAAILVIVAFDIWLIAQRLEHIHSLLEDLMASEQELQATLDTIRDGVAAVAGKLAAQAQQIEDLKAQLAAGTPVSQEQLDALAAEAKSIADALAPLTA